MPFPSWDKLISVVSAALVLSYALAPVTVGALRRNAPELERPFYVKGFTVLGPLAFVIASFIVYWSGWNVISWLLGAQIVLFALYVIFKRYVPARSQPCPTVKVISVASCLLHFNDSCLLPWQLR